MPRTTHALTPYRRLPCGDHPRGREIAAPQKLIPDD